MFLLSIIPISLSSDNNPDDSKSQLASIEARIKNLESLITSIELEQGFDLDPDAPGIQYPDNVDYTNVDSIRSELDIARQQALGLSNLAEMSDENLSLGRLYEISQKLEVAHQRISDLERLSTHINNGGNGYDFDLDNDASNGIQRVSGLNTFSNSNGINDLNIINKEILKAKAYENELDLSKSFWETITESFNNLDDNDGPPTFLKGDLNGDRIIDDDDRSKLNSILNNDINPNTNEKFAADLNNNGEVDSDDLNILTKRLQGPTDADFNYDGILNGADINILQDYLNGNMLFTKAELKNADINNDGSVRNTDITAFLSRFGNRMFGDLNGDGKINNNDLDIATKAKDGSIILTDNELAATQSEDISDLDSFIDSLTARLTDKKKGDINGDGSVDESDYDMLRSALRGDILLTDAEIKAADTDTNGSLSNNDAKLLKKRFEDRLYGDLNNDGKVNKDDYNMAVSAKNNKIILTDAERAATESGETEDLDSFIKSLVKRFKDRQSGDINGDGAVDETDLDLLSSAIDGDALLTDAEIEAADANLDGYLTDDDINLFEKRFEDRVFGDMNNDGKIDERDYDMALAAKNKKIILTEAELKAAISKESKTLADFVKLLDKRLQERQTGDVDGDGKITKTDLDLMKKAKKGDTLLTSVENQAGDFDGDGRISDNDINILSKRLDKKNSGDINGDGRVTNEDVNILQNAINNGTLLTDNEIASLDSDKDKKLTQTDLDALLARFNSKIKGDLNGDGKINFSDANIIGSIINKNYSYTDAEFKAADINKDGKVDNKDWYIASKESEYNANHLGDLNNDGKRDYQDIEILNAYIKRTGNLSLSQLRAADLNQDGQVNGNDLKALIDWDKIINA